MLTSPPYLGVTNYRLDNWIRLWMLGEAPLPNYETSQRYANRMIYEALMRGTLASSALLMKPGGLIYVRTDSRPLTRNLTATILHEVWPDYYLFMRAERIVRSQTHLFGTTEQKPGETDILALGHRALVPAGFEPLPADWLSLVPPANKAA